MARTPIVKVPLVALSTLVALVAVAALARALFAESQRHRRSADGMLEDCAHLAAGDLAYRIGMILDTQLLAPARLMLEESRRTGTLPSVARLREARDPTAGLVPILTRTSFRVDRDDRRAVVADAVDPGSAEWIGQAAVEVSEGWDGSTYDIELHTTRRDGSVALLLCHADRRAPDFGGDVHGFFGDGESLATLLEAVLNGPDRVAAAFGDRMKGSAFTFRVTDETDQLIYATAPHAPEAILGSASTGARHGRLSIEAGLDPARADALLAGGAPTRSTAGVALLAFAALVPLLMVAHLAARERELGRLRSGFVASVSHELRTPLSQLRLFTDTLRLDRARSEPERARALEIIDASARRLEHLVDTVLQSARAERGTLTVRPEPLELAPVVRGAVEEFRPLATARRVTVDERCGDRDRVVGDAGALRTIVLNLLDNALKFGPEGQTIRVRSEADGDAVTLTVDDEGPGVSPAHRRRVWTRFWRAPEHGDATTGAGIGLALVRELAEALGATVDVTAAQGGGARFEVRLRRVTE